MLFKGICKERLANWANAQIQAEKDVDWWIDVVGVDPVRTGDVTLFRLLEWGGIEVLIRYSISSLDLCQGIIACCLD
ncbi:uncharacterized protein BJ212DRAFT_1409916 [Suillus subaureus]|uniref:Uncharacterized protein n=1 Tax=Suillus subaureus TaxID=48587 RepID=A0A9P7ASU2_9AGAM|nr:uncharacterized protein BJ212DRAFT_1409916 [Suillus subaureus]KAG1795837.1 hypothetical protein BJ212DRAFT_1409916 [Suillus subaureus]